MNKLLAPPAPRRTPKWKVSDYTDVSKELMFGNRPDRSGFFRPLTPMCRTQINPPVHSGFYPSAKNTPARKNRCVNAAFVNHRQLEVAVEWRGRNRKPHETLTKMRAAGFLWSHPRPDREASWVMQAPAAAAGVSMNKSALRGSFDEINVW